MPTKNSNSQLNIGNLDWHAFEQDKIFQELDSSVAGLSSEEAVKRLGFYGLNKLPDAKKFTLLQIILHQIKNPLIFILIAAAIASLAIGDFKDAVFILLVIIINSSLGAYQEYNAEKSATSLQSLLKIKAIAKRNNKKQEITSEELVPGDIIFLESGLKVPADCRLLEASSLAIDESFLTGESVAVMKTTAILRKDLGVAERTNMAFAGATVMSGRGLGIVVATGINTQVGKIAKEVAKSKSAKPPLVLRMEKFIKQISAFIIILSIIMAIALRMQGMDIASIFFFIVAMAVSAIPEGLPVALTVALSIATKRMAKRNVIVRNLSSVESLGSCTVIASDKTGTLTVNQQTAKKIVLPNSKTFSISGEGYNGEGEVISDDFEEKKIDKISDNQIQIINRIGVMSNEGYLEKNNTDWRHYGDAMDVALLGLSYKLGVKPEDIYKKFKLENKIAYESERNFSAVFYHQDGKVNIGLKGATETILNFCDSMSENGKIVALDKKLILKQAEKIAEQGYRVLAFAGAENEKFEKKEVYENKDIPPLTFYGLIGFIDPLRPGAKESIAKCQKAGIKVIMITGDHPATAGTIAKELGIINQNQQVLTGQMLDKAGNTDSPAFQKLVTSALVFARVSPTQKLQIVDILIRNGEFVAVTGDGVNDAPALKRANIGVAMGSGTDVAKEIGSMIVVDDNFSSIVAGVEEGRFAYDNVRKVTYLLISTGAAEVLLFIASIIAGLPLPLLAVQLLWLNLVTNGIQDVALAFEGGEPGAMLKKPRKPKEKILNHSMIKQTIVSSFIIALIVFGMWYWLNNYIEMNQIHSRNIILLLMVFMQNFHVFNCRSESVSAFKIPLRRNVLLVFGVLIAQGIHILSMQVPFMQNILRVEPITFNEWLIVLFFAIPILLGMEVFKYAQAKIINR